LKFLASSFLGQSIAIVFLSASICKAQPGPELFLWLVGGQEEAGHQAVCCQISLSTAPPHTATSDTKILQVPYTRRSTNVCLSRVQKTPSTNLLLLRFQRTLRACFSSRTLKRYAQHTFFYHGQRARCPRHMKGAAILGCSTEPSSCKQFDAPIRAASSCQLLLADIDLMPPVTVERSSLRVREVVGGWSRACLWGPNLTPISATTGGGFKGMAGRSDLWLLPTSAGIHRFELHTCVGLM